METLPLTAWEEQERAGLLALETEEWREKRRVAEDSDTTEEVLVRLYLDDVFPVWSNYSSEMKRQRLLLIEALASHPNMMPGYLCGLLGMQPRFADGDIQFSTHSVRGICRNPITPFVCLEMPDFWERTTYGTYLKLLREESLPPLVVTQIAQNIKSGERTNDHSGSRFHVSIAGELPTIGDGQKKLTEFWRSDCAYSTQKTGRRDGAPQHAKLVEWGLAPTWSMGEVYCELPVRSFIQKAYHPLRHGFEVLIERQMHRLFYAEPPLSPRLMSRKEFLHRGGQYPYREWQMSLEATAFTLFVANLHGAMELNNLYYEGIGSWWVGRLLAALKLPLSNEPFPRDFWNRSPLDLMNHLAHDGNHFVRWAARTRLQDPDYKFTWHEEA